MYYNDLESERGVGGAKGFQERAENGHGGVSLRPVRPLYRLIWWLDINIHWKESAVAISRLPQVR